MITAEIVGKRRNEIWQKLSAIDRRSQGRMTVDLVTEYNQLNQSFTVLDKLIEAGILLVMQDESNVLMSIDESIVTIVANIECDPFVNSQQFHWPASLMEILSFHLNQN